MIIIKKLSFAILITAFVFSVTKFYSKQIALPGQLQDIGLFFIIFIGPLISIFLQGRLFGTNEEALNSGILNGLTHEKATVLLVDQGDEIFVHFRNFTGKETNNVREGQRVKFITVSSEKACKQTRSLCLSLTTPSFWQLKSR